MTTIAYRDGICAADTGTTQGGSQFSHTTKIARNTVGDIAAASGETGFCYAFKNWFIDGENGEPPKIERADDHDRGCGVIFRASGEIIRFESSGMFKQRAPFYALGSGRNEALGAMWMGASAVQAVQAAIDLDEGTFGDIDVLSHAPSAAKTIKAA